VEFYKIGQEITKLRKEQKLTQEQLAKNTGTSRQTISKLERGNIDKISLQLFVKILDSLNYELEISMKKPFFYFDVNAL
jgi:transcriptional regulator with XRE-family HTH domain